MSNFPRGYPGAPPSYPQGSSFVPPPPSGTGSAAFRPPSSGPAFFNPGTGGPPTAAVSSNAPPANIPPPSYGAPNAQISSVPSYTPPGVGPPPVSASTNTIQKPSVPFFSTGSGTPNTNQAFSSQPNFSPPPSNVAPPPSGNAIGAPMMMPPPPTGAPAPPVAPPAYTLQYGVTNAPPANSMVGMPTSFDSGSNLAAQNQQAQIPGIDTSGVNGAPPLPTLDEIDLSIQCNPNFLRSSVTKIVNSQSQANASRLPLGIVCKPMCGDKGLKNDEIEVVDFGATGIIRCKRCRTYINPYVTWTDNGRRWRYNI
jgi:protein transport protein SEC24